MTREMLRAKIHRITVTEANVEYEGSVTVDRALMWACDMLPYERVDVYDVENGSRFSTYLIEGEEGSGVCCVNGAAAHLVEPGHRLIICSYCQISDAEARGHKPRVILMDEANRIRLLKESEEAFTLV